MNPRLSKIPFINKFVENLNKDIRKVGLKQALLKSAERNKTKLVVQMEKETAAVLATKAVIIVSNHPHEIEPLVLMASLPKRKDLFLIINNYFYRQIGNLDSHLIPVYSRNNYQFKIKNLRKHLLLSLIEFCLKPKYYSPEKEHQKNIQSINKAALKVQKGGCLIIFPSGGGDNPWYSGVGHLIKNIDPKKEVWLIKAYIKGTTTWDILRLIPNLGPIFPSFKTIFSLPRKITFKSLSDPKTITFNLEKEYHAWAKQNSQKN